jgi:predicted short-subunit dehydrogenase-like oxidoreductase (DUF2520 family)
MQNKNDIQNISIIGAGCVAHFFGQEMKRKGFRIVEIISRSKERAEPLAHALGAKCNVNAFNEIDQSADLYIMSVKDDAIMELRNDFPMETNQLIVHTSGSITSEVFKKTSANFGILYPLQTISRDQNLRIDDVPLFVSGNNSESEERLFSFASKLSGHALILDDDKRLKVHMAAVIASNFPNYLLSIAKEIMDDEGLDFTLLKPLLDETIQKAFDIGPVKAQTGPAKRGDCGVTDKHKTLLKKKKWKKLYGLLTEMIQEDFQKKD